MEIDPEIAHEDVEGELRIGRKENGVGVVLRVIEVEGVADPEVEPEGVELGDRPEDVEIHLRTENEILLLVDLGVIDVVVVFEPSGGAEAEPDRPDEQIIRNPIERLAARFRRRFAGERGTDGILRLDE